MEAKTGVVKITGDITPYSGTADSRVSILDGEKEYRVIPRGAGVDLIDHISALVEVEGLLIEDTEEELCIQVRSYRILDAFDNSWYEDDA